MLEQNWFFEISEGFDENEVLKVQLVVLMCR
jgi:hypothetical protein